MSRVCAFGDIEREDEKHRMVTARVRATCNVNKPDLLAMCLGL